jgi:hypothetical protein
MKYQVRIKEENKLRIIDELKMGPATFTELIDRTKLSRAVVYNRLKELGKEQEIYREYRNGKLLIMLRPKALDPVGSTIRDLQVMALPSKLDSELGQKLLTEPVVAAIAEFDKRILQQTIESMKEMMKIPESIIPPLPKPSFYTTDLISALAQYRFERDRLPELQKRFQRAVRKMEARGLPTEKVKTFAPRPKLMSFLKERRLHEQFDKLLEWINPVLETRNRLSELFNWEQSSELDTHTFTILCLEALPKMLLSSKKSKEVKNLESDPHRSRAN